MTNLIPRVIADVELQIASAIAIGGTSFTLSSANDDDGNALPAGLYCFTVDSGTSNKEYLIGQLNGTAVTSVKTVTRQGVESSGAARAHRVGAPCIVTNFATLQRVADILRGQLDLDGASPVAYDVEPTLTDREQIATVGYVIDTAAGGTVAFDSQVIAGNGGESIVAGNLVYFKTSDQEWYKTDADTAATLEGVQLGIALGTGSDGVAISGGIQISGTYTTSGLTAGDLYYASATAGAIAGAAGATSRVIGLALSTTKLLLIPRNPADLKDAQTDALAGGGDFGTPSSSNKYVTEDFFEASGVDKYTFGVTTSATSTIAHGMSGTPSRVKITAYGHRTSGTSQNGVHQSVGVYNGSNTATVLAGQISSDGSSSGEDQYAHSGTDTTYIVALYDAESGAYRRATVTVDATNINLTWSTSGTISTAKILWEAFG